MTDLPALVAAALAHTDAATLLPARRAAVGAVAARTTGRRAAVVARRRGAVGRLCRAGCAVGADILPGQGRDNLGGTHALAKHITTVRARGQGRAHVGPQTLRHRVTAARSRHVLARVKQAQHAHGQIRRNLAGFNKKVADAIKAGEPIVMRDYQPDIINRFFENPQSVQEVATGAGKTVITAALSDAVTAYGRSIVIVPNKSLVTQTEKDYINLGLDVGV